MEGNVLLKHRKTIGILRRRTKTLLRIAKEERAYYRMVASEREREKDRYQAMLEQRDIYFDLYHDALKFNDERRDIYQEVLSTRCDQLTEARRWAIHFKKKADKRTVIIQKIQTLELKNRRIRNMYMSELEAKVAHLERELEFFMGLQGTRKSGEPPVVRGHIHKWSVEDNLHKDFVERYKEKADSSIELPYAYPTEEDDEQTTT